MKRDLAYKNHLIPTFHAIIRYFGRGIIILFIATFSEIVFLLNVIYSYPSTNELQKIVYLPCASTTSSKILFFEKSRMQHECPSIHLSV